MCMIMVIIPNGDQHDQVHTITVHFIYKNSISDSICGLTRHLIGRLVGLCIDYHVNFFGVSRSIDIKPLQCGYRF